MKVYLTGANGQLGRAMNRVLSHDSVTIVNTEAPAIAEKCGMQALDITDVDEVMRAMRAEKPDVIVNCAAYTAVDRQESDIDLSYKINAIGARNLAIASRETGARLAHVSTDYVFDGKGTRPYIEFDKTGPVSVYGKTKLAGEEFVRAFADRYYILRTAWLYGDGNNFVKTMLRLSETHDEVSVVQDQVGTPTSAYELASAIRFLFTGDNYGIFHATCEGDCSWADFAEEIFTLAGKQTRVNRVSTAEYTAMNPQGATRPAYSILDNYMFRLTSDYRFADWHDAIRAYMEDET